MIHVYVQIAENIYISFLSISTFLNVMFEISRKLLELGGLYVILTVIGVVLGNRISKIVFSVTFGKKSFCT